MATALGALLGVSWAGAGRRESSSAWRLSVASTVVVIRVLSDHNVLHTPAGHITVGWLVVEDVFTVVALVLLPAMFGGEQPQSIWLAIAVTALKVCALVAFHRHRRRAADPEAARQDRDDANRASCSR